MISFHIVDFEPPEGVNIIAGTSHFIKTVEDLYEALITSSPHIKFGLAFCEASGPTLIRKDGNDEGLTRIAVEIAERISAGHFFVIAIKDAYPINILDRIKHVQEVVNVFVASANPLQFLVAETEQGRAVIGVIDGFKSKGVEGEEEEKERHDILRKFGYKK
jgi:hypothetical protein